MSAGRGDDTIIGSAGSDTIDGGTGFDTMDYSRSPAPINVDLATGRNTGGFAQGDTLHGVENVIGSSKGDTIKGDDGPNTLSGNAGDVHRRWAAVPLHSSHVIVMRVFLVPRCVPS